MKVALLIYVALYAALWYTFFEGPTVYLDRFADVMTGCYILTNLAMSVICIVLGIAIAQVKKSNIKVPPVSEEAVAKLTKSRKSWSYLLHKYLGFYPAIFCAGILLGYWWLFIAMLYDSILSIIMFALADDFVIAMKEKSK